jgi:uncharacterized membrane protein YecN with MAPEG domain
MYAVLNTFAAVESSSTIGRCESIHRTRAAADAADARLQRACKRNNGTSSYLPTRIVEVKRTAKAGALLDTADLA